MVPLYFLLVFSIKGAHPLSDSNNYDNGVCTEGYFQCANETVCVPQNNNCDGKFDCSNGSDEIDCDDVHGDDFYDHLVRKRPSAEHDDYDTNCYLPYNGTSCICRHKDLLCLYKNLTKAPNDLPTESVDLLDFNGNHFQVLTVDSLATVPQVNKLSLMHCSIMEIDKGAFTKLNGVHHLILDNNSLKTLPAGLFTARNNLRTLSVMYNEIAVISRRAFTDLSHLIELDLRGNKITEIKMDVLQPLKNLTVLYLQGNRIRYIDAATFPPLPLIELSLMENRIVSLGAGAFATMPTIRNLFLSNNQLVELKNGSFHNLTLLRVLTLNDNAIKTIEIGVFQDVPNLSSLKLERNQFRTLDKRVLQPLQKLPYIYFDRFEMCAAATHVRVCYPRGDGISSQEHLLDNPILRASVWVMGAIGCIGNLIVLLGRLVAPTNNVVHSLYLRNLAFSDLLMGIYLFVIAAADHYYRGIYLRYQYWWRHSFVCNLCGFLSTLSCESSVLILSLVTWDRFVSITQPLARKQPSPKMAAMMLLLLWSVATAVASAPLTAVAHQYFGDEFYGSNGVCLSLHIHDPYSNGWEYSAAMFVLLNTIALAFICYAYLRMIHEIRASGIACRSTRQAQERDKVAQRFGIIVLTDSLCWVPVIVVKLVALSGFPIHRNLYAWLAIFILPINSALNPVLYTLTTTVFKKQARKIMNSCIHKRKQRENQQSASESGFSLSFGVFPIAGSRRRFLNYRGTQSSVTTRKNSCKKPTAV